MMVVAIFLGAFVDDQCYLQIMSQHGNRKLNKPFRTPSASKKFGVYVRNKRSGRVQIVRFGAKGMPIRKNSCYTHFTDHGFNSYYIQGIKAEWMAAQLHARYRYWYPEAAASAKPDLGGDYR